MSSFNDAPRRGALRRVLIVPTERSLHSSGFREVRLRGQERMERAVLEIVPLTNIRLRLAGQCMVVGVELVSAVVGGMSRL